MSISKCKKICIRNSNRLVFPSTDTHGLLVTDSWFTDSWSRTAVHVSKGEKQEKRSLERPHLGETLAKQFLSLVVVTRCCLNFVGVLLVV
ncbi:UNVERIFIED_CONTAM: hypothetical protein NCL1_64026 [Trichonephila clavipes]